MTDDEGIEPIETAPLLGRRSQFPLPEMQEIGLPPPVIPDPSVPDIRAPDDPKPLLEDPFVPDLRKPPKPPPPGIAQGETSLGSALPFLGRLRRVNRKAWMEITDDPRFPFMVGRLIGAAEGSAALLRSGDSTPEQQKAMAERLSSATSWFLEQSLGDSQPKK